MEWYNATIFWTNGKDKTNPIIALHGIKSYDCISAPLKIARYVGSYEKTSTKQYNVNLNVCECTAGLFEVECTRGFFRLQKSSIR